MWTAAGCFHFERTRTAPSAAGRCGRLHRRRLEAYYPHFYFAYDTPPLMRGAARENAATNRCSLTDWGVQGLPRRREQPRRLADTAEAAAETDSRTLVRS